MTADVAALEARLLLPLRRAAEDAIMRLGMTLDPDRELPEAELPGGDAAEAAAAAGPQSPRHMAGGTDHAGAGAELNVSSGPRVTQEARPQALRLAPARREDVDAPVQLPEPALGDDGAAGSVPAGGVQVAAEAADARLSAADEFLGESRGASAAPAAGWQMAGQMRFAEAPVAFVAQLLGMPPVLPAPEMRLAAAPPPPLARGLAEGLPSSPAQAGAGSGGEVPLQSPSGLPVRPAQDDPAAGSLMTAAADQGLMAAAAAQGLRAAPAAGGLRAAPAAGGLMTAGDLPPASGATGRPALPEEVFGAPAAPEPVLPPEEKFGGLMPVRSVAGTPGGADHAAAFPGAAPYPAAAAVTAAYPMLGEVARAVQPVLSRAAGLGEAAWDDGEAPNAAAPSVSNTFNVTVAMAGNSGPVEREALQDALTDLLRDAARRQGLDL